MTKKQRAAYMFVWRRKKGLVLSDVEKARRKKEALKRTRESARNNRRDSPRFRLEARLYQLNYRYGLSREQAQLLDQIKNCQLCGHPFAATILADKKISRSRNTPCVDHDHSSGKIRGVLCSTCNGIVGAFEGWSESGLLDRIKNYIDLPGPTFTSL